MIKLLRLSFPIILFLQVIGYACAGTITINGHVKDNTCEVDVSSRDFTVALGNVSSKQFSQAGAGGPYVLFNIVFSRCGSAASKIKVGFTGTVDTLNKNLLKISQGATGYASGLGVEYARGLGVEISDKDKNVIKINEQQTNLDWNNIDPSTRNVLTFYSRMVATQTPVVGGAVSATATFTLEFF